MLVVIFVAAAVAALAGIGSGRVVQESRLQTNLEAENQAFRDAYAQLHFAFNIVNTSAYDRHNHNLELQASMRGDHGGTVAGETDTSADWLRDPADVVHGYVRGSDVRVYEARDYVQRIAHLKGEDASLAVDAENVSSAFFVLEAQGRSGDTVRAVSALVRENEPFSSFVFFQNKHTLGVSGAPRGLIHANDTLDFYFPNGLYVDSVSAANGFGYQAGATPENTNLVDANPEAPQITLEDVDFDELKLAAGLFRGSDGLDAEVRFQSSGQVEIKQYTPPHWETVERTYTQTVLVGYETRTFDLTRLVQTGTVQEARVRQVVSDYEVEYYTVTTPIYEDREVTLTRQVPIYEPQTVTKTRWVKVFVPYETEDAGGGTAVGGGAEGVPGEYQWVQEQYETTEDVLVGYKPEEYLGTERVRVGETVEELSRLVPVLVNEVYYVDVPVYETEHYTEDREVAIYEEQPYTEMVEEFFRPVHVDTTLVDLGTSAGTIYVDGRVTRLQGDVVGRATLIGNEKVRITGNLRYRDADGDPAMENGSDYTKAYVRNADYDGRSTLGVIARDDVLFTHRMPSSAEVNATLMSVQGRVGVEGIGLDANGNPTRDTMAGLTDAQREIEQNYNRTSYYVKRFVRDSLRRMGGIISNERIVETYIRSRRDGTAYVNAGFKRGQMRFDLSLIFSPPPNFVQVPRPVVMYYAPLYFARQDLS
jgi:hypothetical protein